MRLQAMLQLRKSPAVVERLSEPARDTPRLRVVGLRVRFGPREVLHGVDATFESNRITALIGPTGCGKTTLLRTLNRLNEFVPGFQVQGRVEVDGQDVYREVKDVRDLRRRVGMLFQRPNPFPQSIEENIAIGLRSHHIVTRNQLRLEVERQLRDVGLWEAVKDKLGESPFGLSGGQQQMLCLARTLAVRPEVILLDEPTSSLDPVSTQRVEELLVALKSQVSILLVTHNLQQASRIADQVIFMYAGNVVESNTASQFFLNPKSRLAEDYITGRIG